MPSTQQSPTVQRRRLGHLLKKFRNEANLTGDEVGEKMERTDSWVFKLEKGQTGIRTHDLHLLLATYGVTDPEIRKELEDLAKGGRQRGWWSKFASVLSKEYSTYIGFEAEASRLLVYDGLVVHGLLQTEDYARAVNKASAPTDGPETIDRKVQVRMNRQKRLTDPDRPLVLWVIFDEAVLHHVVAGDIPRHLRQLDRLLEVARDVPTIQLQVVPFKDFSHPGMLSAFTIMNFEDDPELVYIEGLTGDIYEDPPESQRYNMVFDNLRAAALSETATIAKIEEVRAELA